MKTKRIIYIFLLMICIVKGHRLFAQKKDTIHSFKTVGLSLQIYPAGLISCVTFENYVSQKGSLLFRLGINYADRKDYSPYNDNEKGKGFGGSMGYRKHVPLKLGKIVFGLHCDIWNMWINWKNDIGEPNYTKGQTYTLVLQPWIEGGYFIRLKSIPLQFGITTGFGREINVVTNGKDVGQGWMNSLLLHFNYMLKRT